MKTKTMLAALLALGLLGGGAAVITNDGFGRVPVSIAEGSCDPVDDPDGGGGDGPADDMPSEIPA